jgi:hypothetical protein
MPGECADRGGRDGVDFIRARRREGSLVNRHTHANRFHRAQHALRDCVQDAIALITQIDPAWLQAAIPDMADYASQLVETAQWDRIAAICDHADEIAPERKLFSAQGNVNDPLAVSPDVPLEDLTDDYRADDPRLQKYHLPAGVTLTTEAAMTRMADLLGIKRGVLKETWDNTQCCTHHPAHDDQPPNTRNIQVWQVLMLIDSGCMGMPDALSVDAR